MNLSAIYHVSDDNYCYPLDEDKLVIKLRTGRDVTGAALVWGDPFDAGLFGSDSGWDGKKVPMEYSAELRLHKIWRVVVEPPFKRCRYYFIVTADDGTYYFTESGAQTPAQFEAYKGRRQDFYFPWMNSADIIRPAKWVSETVWYQIFPDRFCRGREDTEGKFFEWTRPDQTVTNYQQYGGDLKGIESRLDYLKDLGVSGIYFTPINESPSIHKYSTTNYYKIDPAFGTNDDIKSLVREAHKRGIRIMLDGVFNHCGMEFPLWKDVVEKGPESKYWNWFMVKKYPLTEPFGKARRGEFFSFAFSDKMPKLNTNNDEVIDYFIDVCTTWVKEYDIDAIRLDVANELSHKFNKRLRKALFDIKPDFYICGEIWHYSKAWLRGDEYDSVMNYTLLETIESFWRNPSLTAKDFEHGISECMNQYCEQTCGVMFNLLDSHDTTRLITRCGCNEDEFYQELCALFTLNGTVCFYYGTEVRLEGGHDPDCRRCMPWREIESGIYDDRIAEMKKLIALRRSSPAFRTGSISFKDSGDDRVIIYEKSDGDKTYTVALNVSDHEISIGEHGSVLYSRGLDGDTLGSGGICVSENEK